MGFLIIVILYFIRLISVSFISYLFLVQLTMLNFLVVSAFFVLILARLNLKFFGHQLESNFVWSTLLKLLRAATINFLVPSLTLWSCALIFVLVISDFLSFRFVGRLLAVTLFFLGGAHIGLYLVVFIIPVILRGINFLQRVQLY